MKDFKYIIMAGGNYVKWSDKPKHLVEIGGEPLVARTIRLLREVGANDIAISSDNPVFEQFGVPVLKHENNYTLDWETSHGDWYDAFYPMDDPVCYLFGDVVFSRRALKTIVRHQTDAENDIMFFASAPPFADNYCKPWAEPFAFKVANTEKFFLAIEKAKRLEKEHVFYRQPVSWDLWQIIKETPVNIINYQNYVAINDFTCDIDTPEDIEKFSFLN